MLSPLGVAVSPDNASVYVANRDTNSVSVFKRELAARMGGRSHGFDHAYFDDPEAVSGFRGYHEGGNAAEGARHAFTCDANDPGEIGTVTFHKTNEAMNERIVARPAL